MQRSELLERYRLHVLDDPSRYHEELVRPGQHVVLRRVRQCRGLHQRAIGCCLPTATSNVDFFGIGVVQQIDAAAMEVFLGWRRFETDVTGAGAGSGNSDLDLVHGGARIRF